MIALKIALPLMYGWFLARFCLKLFKPRYPGLLLHFLFPAYIIFIDHYLISQYLQDFTAASLVTHIGLAALIILLFRGDTVKKIAIGAIIYAVYNLSSYLVVIPLFLSDDASEPILIIIERSRFVAAVFLLELISRKCTRLGDNIPRKFSSTILLPVLFVVLANEIIYFVYQRIHLSPLIALMQGREVLPEHYFYDASAVLFTAVFGLVVLLIVVFANNTMLESQLREQQLKLQIEHYKALERSNQSLTALRHDMKNHILSLQGFLSQGETAEAKRYLEKMSESGGQTEPEITTGNSAIDALLNDKYRQAAGDIDFKCDVRLPKAERLDSFDLCVILGNAADNAIEACRKCDCERFVHIKVGVVKSFLLIEVKNSTVSQELPLETDKPAPEFHGIGLKNIRALTERNGGAMDIELENGVFILSVLLPL